MDHADDTIRAITGSTAGGGYRLFWLDTLLLALALRVLLVPLSPYFGYPGDHDDFVRWGVQAVDDGLTSLYDHPPRRLPLRVREDGEWITTERRFDRLCNYPPGSVYRLAVSGWLFSRLSSDRLVNTTLSQYCFSSWMIACDLILAAGAAALARHFADERAARWAWGLMLFLPPLWWDSVVWAQTDTMLLAPAIWMLWSMVRQRWLLAGVLWGVAASLKPQAILLLPVWGLALLAPPRSTARAGVASARWQPLAGLVAGALTLNLIALPFTLHSGWAWFRASYWENLFATYAHLTTLKAFNVWYVDLLLTLSDDATTRCLGLTRDAWGKLMLMAALLAGLAWSAVRWRGRAEGLLLYASLSLLAFMMLPTQVHERYLVLVLPFLCVASVKWPGVRAGFAGLTIVALAQVTWPIWLDVDPAGMREVREAAKAAHVELRQFEAHRLPPELRSLPDLEAVFTRAYRELRARTAPIEWVFVVLAIASSAATVTAIVRIRSP